MAERYSIGSTFRHSSGNDYVLSEIRPNIFGLVCYHGDMIGTIYGGTGNVQYNHFTDRTLERHRVTDLMGENEMHFRGINNTFKGMQKSYSFHELKEGHYYYMAVNNGDVSNYCYCHVVCKINDRLMHVGFTGMDDKDLYYLNGLIDGVYSSTVELSSRYVPCRIAVTIKTIDSLI